MIAVIRGEIGWGTVDRIRAASAASAGDELMIVIQSEGGDVAAALAVADIIERHRGPTVGRVNKFCHSAAIGVLAVCATRTARPGAVFQMHLTSPLSTPSGRLTAPRLRQLADGLAATDTRFRARIAAATGAPVSQIAELEETGAILGALEALSINLLNAVDGYPALTALAARRRAERAAAMSPAWTMSDMRRIAAMGLVGRPMLIAPAALRAMLRGA